LDNTGQSANQKLQLGGAFENKSSMCGADPTITDAESDDQYTSATHSNVKEQQQEVAKS
jgi:hypothetical protein